MLQLDTFGKDPAGAATLPMDCGQADTLNAYAASATTTTARHHASGLKSRTMWRNSMFSAC
jgi:hypothetical protein